MSTATAPKDATQARLLPETRPESVATTVRLDKLPLSFPGVTDDAFVRQLAESLAAVGMLHPIGVRAVNVFNSGTNYPPDRYDVIYGRRRVQAARVAGWQTVPALVYDSDLSTEAVLTLAENLQRERNVLAELEAMAQLQTDKFATPKDLARTFGLSVHEVARLLTLRKLVPELYAALASGKLAVGVAYQVAKLPQALQRERLVPVLTDKGRIQGPDVREARQARTATAQATLGDLSALMGDQGSGDVEDWEAPATPAMATDPDRWKADVLGHLDAALAAMPARGAPKGLVTALRKARTAVA
jgi:ParB/RepB/Spo0J family partition protein